MIEETLDKNYTAFGVPITLEADIWYYSTTTFPDGAPVNNWWQVLEKNEDGSYKYKLASHPTSKLGFASDMSNMVLHSEELEKAYKDLYGTDLEYTYDASELGVEENNAGYEWLYRYLQADLTTFTDSDEVVEYVNTSTPEEPILGFCTSLKLDNARDAGFTLDYITDMAPFSGFAKTKYVYICTNTDSPAAARLFAFFALGGEDGKGAGYVPFVDREGAYPTISTFDASAINRFTLEELGSMPTDLEFVYDHYLDVQDFWTLYADRFMS
jgi:iron(III) transport system substrate-binding protein